MRFTDGLWKRPVGTEFVGGVEVVEVLKANDDGVEFLVAPKHVASRGDTLNSPLLTVNISSPLNDVIKVRIDHHQGCLNQGPEFELFPDGPAPTPQTSTIKSPESITFKTGNLSVDINTQAYSYGLTFKDNDKTIVSTQPKGSAVVDLPYHLSLTSASSTSYMSAKHDSLEITNHTTMGQQLTGGWVRFMMTELSLGVGECIYGLGERFGPFVKNGGLHQIWNQDGGTDSEQAYKNIPFYLSNKGYGVFVAHPEEVEFEVGREKCSKVGISVKGETLEFFIIGGGSMKAAMGNYTALLGKPPVPPAWTYGLYLSSSFTTEYDSDTVSSFLNGMKERDCPVRVFHFDCFWMKRYDWSSFDWDADNFANPKAILANLKKEHNVKVCVWINPYIAQRASIFKEGKEKGYFIKRTNGSVWQWDEWQPGMAIVDFTNPEAYKWYFELIAGLCRLGVDTIKTDFGERIPHLGVTYSDCSDPMKMHNYYTHLYNKCVWEAIASVHGEDQAVLFARSATAGGQRFPVHWGGDCESTYEAMAETLRGGLSLACSGFAYWSMDIGGFEGTPNQAIFSRWVCFGLFLTHSRFHGSNSYRVPWEYNAVETTSKMIHAKLRLMPYIYGQSIIASETGIPVLRPMVMEFPEDRTCSTLDLQYMFGETLLVAPVFHDSMVEFYLPAGKWTDIFTDEVIEGPRWIKRENVPLDVIPVFARENSVLCLGPEGIDIPDYEYGKVELEVRTYQLRDEEVEVRIPTGKGKSYAGTVKVKDGKVTSELNAKLWNGRQGGGKNVL